MLYHAAGSVWLFISRETAPPSGQSHNTTMFNRFDWGSKNTQNITTIMDVD